MHSTRRFLAAFACALAVMVAPAIAFAQQEASELRVSTRTFVILIGTAILGGIVSWIAKVRAGTAGAASLTYLVGEICTSAFAGFLCFLACDSMGMSLRLTILLVGVSGHMGTRAIAWFEKWAEGKWGVLMVAATAAAAASGAGAATAPVALPPDSGPGASK